MAAHQALPSLGFSRQEHWNGLSCPSRCMKVKSESEVAQSCPTLCDPMDCSSPGSSAHGIFQARELEWDRCLLCVSCQQVVKNVNAALQGQNPILGTEIKHKINRKDSCLRSLFPFPREKAELPSVKWHRTFRSSVGSWIVPRPPNSYVKVLTPLYLRVWPEIWK